jgi:hypothetical protein
MRPSIGPHRRFLPFISPIRTFIPAVGPLFWTEVLVKQGNV